MVSCATIRETTFILEGVTPKLPVERCAYVAFVMLAKYFL